MGERLSVSELLDGHVALEVECFDRLYLNGYVQNLQTSGGVVFFLHDHRGYPIPSPAPFPAARRGFLRTWTAPQPLAARASSRSVSPRYSFRRGERRISVFYFYLHDREWGACFLKIAAVRDVLTQHTALTSACVCGISAA